MTDESGSPKVHDISTTRSGPSRKRRNYSIGKEDYLTRLRKIEGQIRGVQKMVEKDIRYPDIVMQIASATRALQEVAVGLLTEHLRNCVSEQQQLHAESGIDPFDEIAATIRGAVRL